MTARTFTFHEDQYKVNDYNGRIEKLRNNIEKTPSFDEIAGLVAFNHDAAVRGIARGARGSIASMNQESVPIRAPTTHNREGIAMGHVVVHDLLAQPVLAT